MDPEEAAFLLSRGVRVRRVRRGQYREKERKHQERTGADKCRLRGLKLAVAGDSILARSGGGEGKGSQRFCLKACGTLKGLQEARNSVNSNPKKRGKYGG